MVTLESIRNRAGLLVSAVGVALFAFVVGDLFSGGQTFWSQSQDKVVVINGERVSTEKFHGEVDELTEIYKMQTGQSSLSAEYGQQINQQVFENIVRETLIGKEADKLGMLVSKEELTDLVSGDNISPVLMQMPFFKNPQTGEFDKSLLLNFLQSVVNSDDNSDPQLQQARQFWLFWEKNIKAQRLEDKFVTLLSSAIMPNSIDIKAQFEGAKSSVDFAYAMQSLSTIPDSAVTVTAAEVKAHYNQVKEARFKQGETRTVKYFAVDIVPSEDDFLNAEQEINRVLPEFAATTDLVNLVNGNSEVPYMDAFVAVESLIGDEKQLALNGAVDDIFGPYLERNTYRAFRLADRVSAPDSVKVRHIMLPVQNEATTRQLADSLINVLKVGGNFAALAEEFSVDQNAQAGDLGWFTEVAALRSVGAEFKNAIFTAQGNTYFVVRTQYAMHIAQVTERTKSVSKVKIAEYAIEVTPSSRTFQKMYNDINTFIATHNNLSKFEAEASENGYYLITNNSLASTDYNLGIVRDARSAVRWAFHNKPGAISEVYEIDNKFVVLAVISENPSGYAPLDQVEPILRRELMAPKKAEKIIAALQAKSPSSLQAYASEMGSKIDTAKYVSFNTSRITGIGFEPILTGSAPFAAENTLVGPLAGKNAVYVYDVSNRNQSEAPFDAQVEKSMIERNWNQTVMYQFVEVLKNRAKIEDYRINFY